MIYCIKRLGWAPYKFGRVLITGAKTVGFFSCRAGEAAMDEVGGFEYV